MFIEIVNGVSVNVDAIHSVERLDNMTCRVTMDGNMFDSSIPYEMIMNMIKNNKTSGSSFESGDSPYASQYVAM